MTMNIVISMVDKIHENLTCREKVHVHYNKSMALVMTIKPGNFEPTEITNVYGILWQ